MFQKLAQKSTIKIEKNEKNITKSSEKLSEDNRLRRPLNFNVRFSNDQIQICMGIEGEKKRAAFALKIVSYTTTA